MLGDTATEDANRRRPFEFLSSIFKRRREHEGIDTEHKPPDIQFEESNFYNESWLREDEVQSPPLSTPSPIRSSLLIASAAVGIPLSVGAITSPSKCSVMMSPGRGAHGGTCSPSYAELSTSPGGASSCASPLVLHQTPIKSRDIGEDMEAIRLSRQDNPYLQRVGGSQTSLAEDDALESHCGPVVEEKDTTQLVSQSRGSQDSILSLTEVHEHLIRSPPPTTVPKTLTGKGIFVFPMEAETALTNRPITSSSKTQSLNPLVSRGHENVLDHNLRQILDTQRKFSQKGDKNHLSCSVPGSPARQSLPLQVKSHVRTHSEEAAIVTSTEGGLAPVVLPGRRPQPSPNEIFITRPLQQLSSPLRPLNRSLKPMSSDVLVSCSPNGSSSSLTLPIRCPHQPASPKIT